MRLRARYATAPSEGGSSPAEILFADGTRASTGDSAINRLLTAALGHEVSLWPLLSADALDHYRRGAPTHEDLEEELRAIFGRTPDEPLPDLSLFPPELLEFESPPGTYFDAFPLLLMTTESLATMQQRAPNSAFDLRRFRPNFVISAASTGDPFPEQAWRGRRLLLGGAVLRVTVECPRCVMTTNAVDELPKDPGVMRALVRETGGNLGVYATVEIPGPVRVGDEARLLGESEDPSA